MNHQRAAFTNLSTFLKARGVASRRPPNRGQQNTLHRPRPLPEQGENNRRLLNQQRPAYRGERLLSQSKFNQMAASNSSAKAPEAHFSAGGTGAGIYFKAPPVFCAPVEHKEDPAIDSSNLAPLSLFIVCVCV
jgi:hypothetical protein